MEVAEKNKMEFRDTKTRRSTIEKKEAEEKYVY